MIRRAIELHVTCVIVCQAEVDQELLDMDTDTCIISTPYDAYRAVHLICHALPIERICNSHDLVCFHLDDYIDDVRNTVLESRFRAYPILDENEHVVGTLSRYHLLRPRRKQVILVDHNEKAQSVPGLRSWRSWTITGWRILKPRIPSTSATNPWAAPPPSWRTCTRKRA